MRLPRTALVAGVLASALAAPPAMAAPPDQPGNCVSVFASTLGKAGVAGQVISGGARDPVFHPFGFRAVREEAHATFPDCPFTPEMFLP